MSNYNLLIEKLDAFIRRYYKNRLIRGAIYSFALGLIFYLGVTTLEYFGHFSTTLRTILFYSFILGNIFIIGRYVVIPLSHLYRYGKIISHEQAAIIIGKHFPEVQDKLLNVLQLHRLADETALELRTSKELVLAGIDQKTIELKPIPFASAINFGENRKYLRYALVPLLILVVIVVAAPSMIGDSTKRLIEHGTYFEKPAPFSFEILNDNLKAIQQEDFQLNVKVDGTEIPDAAYIEMEGNQFKLEKENKILFHHLFKNLQKSLRFRLFADGWYSPEYSLDALPNPVLMNFDVALEYPAYLNIPNERLQNTGDLVIPVGTKVNWTFNTRNTSRVSIAFRDTNVLSARTGDERFSFARKFMQSNGYSVHVASDVIASKDSMLYSINVIPDAYPSINSEEQRDSFSTKRVYFKGIIKDDYGFSKLTFNFRYLKTAAENVEKDKIYSQNIPLSRNVTQQQYYHYWDMSDAKINPGDELEYYFEVWDNDGINGPKASRSQAMVFKAPTLEEIEADTKKSTEDIKDKLEQSIDQARKLQKNMEDLSRKMMDKNDLGWEERKKAEELLKQQQELEKQVNEIKRDNEKKDVKESEYKQVNPEIAQKQQQLQQLMEKLMSEDMKKLLEQLQQMMDKLDKKQLQEQLDKMKLDNKEMEKALDRTLELFKQMEIEKTMKESIEKLDKLSKEQEKLSEQTDKKKEDNNALKEKQADLNKQMEDISKEMREMFKKNQELEFPNQLMDTDPEEKDIKQDMQSSSEELGNNKNSKASKSQKSASQKMKKLSELLGRMQESMASDRQEEDMESLRALLENLLRLSFDQENLMEDLRTTDINDPKFLEIGKTQRKLKDDAKMIEDSLLALSKRVVQIQSAVNQEIGIINDNMEKTIDELQDRYVPQAASSQQYIMTSVNNLALMLNESLSQMQSQCKKAGQCKKPGNGQGQKPSSASQLRAMQQQLNDRMQKLQQGMKPGESKIPRGSKMSEEISKMAAEQEFIRNELNKMNQDMNNPNKEEGGKKPLGDLNGISNKMEQTETDLVNKMLTSETLKRQQEILTRLLEAEKAERERDMDEKRQSETAKEQNHRNPPEFEEYKRLKMKELEFLRTVPPSLNSFYKKRVSEYFQTIDK
jgi:hypothetical protein